VITLDGFLAKIKDVDLGKQNPAHARAIVLIDKYYLNGKIWRFEEDCIIFAAFRLFVQGGCRAERRNARQFCLPEQVAQAEAETVHESLRHGENKCQT
jgi:hypothetical protein